MKFSKFILSAFLFGAPRVIAAQSQPLTSPARVCAGAAQSLRSWGWSDGSQGSAASLTSIVSAVNRQLRSSEGRLTHAEISRLEKGAASSDACVRELARGVLKTQLGTARPQRADRVADAGKGAGLPNCFVSIASEKSVTRLSEKQSPTSEAISP
jgi:hypothetical protein